MKIVLTQLRLINFMGAKDQTIDFGNTTEILGANATGKTRLWDAFTWLLFGKNSDDRQDFNIKALDANNEPLHRADHSVIAIMMIDGRKQKIERTYREKWVKKRGEEVQEFDGHETLYKVNDVPYKQSDFNGFVHDIIPENLFKLLTHPFYFNTNMKWNERREILFKIAGGINDADVLAGVPELRALFDSLDGKSVDDFKREIAAKKKLLKESLADIPARMDEVSRSIQSDPDYAGIEKQIADLNKEIESIESLITSKASKFDKKNRENQAKQNQIYELKDKIRELEYKDQEKASAGLNNLRFKKADLQNRIDGIQSSIASFQVIIRTEENAINSLESENDGLRKEWCRINEETLSFSDDEFICPTCKRRFEADDIQTRQDQMKVNFNSDKANRLARINEKGRNNKAEIERLRVEIKRITDQIKKERENVVSANTELGKIVIPYNPAVTADPQINTVSNQVVEIEKTIETIKAVDNSELINKKTEILSTLDDLKKQLTIRESNAKLHQRMTELEDQLRSLSQQIAGLEKQEFQCEKFIRTKIGMIEDKINGLFKFVRFKMFNTQVNGGLEETCEALIDGVPFQDANNAGKIYAGLDIIRTLSGHYDFCAPVWIDNRESCTEIPDMDCQIINLLVDPKYKELNVINKN